MACFILFSYRCVKIAMAASIRQVVTKIGRLKSLPLKQTRCLSSATDRLLVSMDDKTGLEICCFFMINQGL